MSTLLSLPLQRLSATEDSEEADDEELFEFLVACWKNVHGVATSCLVGDESELDEEDMELQPEELELEVDEAVLA